MKHFVVGRKFHQRKVAPFVGAWIETIDIQPLPDKATVAPFVGAWIETDNFLDPLNNFHVAPFVGAWIETP